MSLPDPVDQRELRRVPAWSGRTRTRKHTLWPRPVAFQWTSHWHGQRARFPPKLPFRHVYLPAVLACCPPPPTAAIAAFGLASPGCLHVVQSQLRDSLSGHLTSSQFLGMRTWTSWGAGCYPAEHVRCLLSSHFLALCTAWKVYCHTRHVPTTATTFTPPNPQPGVSRLG